MDSFSSTTSMSPKAKILLTVEVGCFTCRETGTFVPPGLLHYQGDSAPLGPWLGEECYWSSVAMDCQQDADTMSSQVSIGDPILRSRAFSMTLPALPLTH